MFLRYINYIIWYFYLLKNCVNFWRVSSKKTCISCLLSLGFFASILIRSFSVLVIYHMMLETLFPSLSFKFNVLSSNLKCVDINFFGV